MLQINTREEYKSNELKINKFNVMILKKKFTIVDTPQQN
jgi:hypothetical protein